MIDGQEFLDLAKRWSAGSSEAEWRSAVRRAYYAAFHRARRVLRELGFQVPRGDRAHAYLWRRLSNSGEAQVQTAGSDLNSLRGDRNQADYEVDRTLSRREALLQVESASRIVQILNAAAVEPARAQVTEAMKRYEEDVLKEVTWQPQS